MDKYRKWLTRPSSVARDELFVRYMLKQGLKEFIVIPLDNRTADYYVEEESYLQMLPKLFNQTINNWKKHLEEYSQKREFLLNASKAVEEAVKNNIKGIPLYEKYKEVGKGLFGIAPYIFFPFALNELVEEDVMKEYPNDFKIITSLSKATAFHLFQKSLLTEKAEDIVKEFGWLNLYSLIEEPYTKGDIERLKKEVDKKEIKESFQELESNKEKFEKFISKIKDPDKVALFTLMNEYAYLRTDRVDIFREALYHLIFFYDYLSGLISTKCELKDAIEISDQEIKELLTGEKVVKLKELKLRSSKKGIFYYAPGIFKFIHDKKEMKEILDKIKEIRDDQKFLKGMVAFPGKIEGKVRLILSDEKAKKFKEGEILVARFTEPKHTPYIKKASAIITDDGGITSHAAITSRELKIPCVIGTKNATKVLKDGDLIEVDAEKGVIKKV